MGKKIAIALGVIAVVVALVACLVPLKEVAYTVTIDYQDTETYYEDEPYEVMEICYEPLEYQYLGWGFGGGPHYKLMNRGEVAGHFTVRLVLYTIGEDKYLDLVWEYPQGFPEEVIESNFQKSVIEEILYLKPKEEGEVQWSWEELGVDPAETEYDGRWEVLPEEVGGEKTVIRYKQVQKQRTVTKQRPETRYKKVTLLDYLLHY